MPLFSSLFLSKPIYFCFLLSMSVGDMTLSSACFSVIGQTNPSRMRSVNGSWRLESFLCPFYVNDQWEPWVMPPSSSLFLSKPIYFCFLRSMSVEDMTLASVPFSVIVRTDPSRMRSVNGSWRLASCLCTFWIIDPLVAGAMTRATVFICVLRQLSPLWLFWTMAVRDMTAA